MSKIYNFSAGPACLPSDALESASKAINNYKNIGISLLEMSHRSKPVIEIFEQTNSNLKKLLSVPDNYNILWLQGGASTQFSMVPMNLLPIDGTADYIETGIWSEKAIKECERIANVNIIGTSKESNYSYIPKDITFSEESSYVHLTSNNTIYGTQFKSFNHLEGNNSFLVADMSSDILSRNIDITKFGLIYAGAQKNIGPAGVTLVIIRSDLIELNYRNNPMMMRYQTHVEKKSMFNTPPVFSVFVVNETLKWLQKLGGISEMENLNVEKANLLYTEIERNSLFISPVKVEDRSLMNIPFIFSDDRFDDADFLDFCLKRGLSSLKGHRSVGGFRASLYNAMPKEGVHALVKAMKEYETKNI